MADTVNDEEHSARAAFGEVAGSDDQGLFNAIAYDLSQSASGEADSHVSKYLHRAVWVIVDSHLRIKFGLDPSQQIWGQSPEKNGHFL